MPKPKKPKRKHAHLSPWARVDRESAARAARIHLGAAYELLEVDVNFGLHVLQQAETIRLDERASLTAFAALLLFHRGIELLDAISALAKAGCAEPATVLLRAYLEAILYSRYLMTVNDERVAAALLVSEILVDIDRSTADAAAHAPGSRPTILARERRELLLRQVAETRIWNEARRELERLNKESSVPVPWYQAFGGPRTLGALSGRVNDPLIEEVFEEHYDLWSEAAHSGNLFDSINPELTDATCVGELFRPLRRRSRDEAVFVVFACHALFHLTVHHHMEYFRSAPDGLREWLAVADKLRESLA